MRGLGARWVVAGCAGCLAAAAAALAPAVASAEAWQFFRPGDVVVSPMRPGTFLSTGSAVTGTALALATDVDYQVRSQIAVGGLFDLGFRSEGYALQLGPVVKYRFRVGDTPHAPYLRGALPFHIGSGSAFALGLFQLGGGYQYYFHRILGLGLDVALTPTVLLHPTTDFELVASITLGVTLKY